MRWGGLNAMKVNLNLSRHGERSEAIQDFKTPGLPRCARSDGRFFMCWDDFATAPSAWTSSKNTQDQIWLLSPPFARRGERDGGKVGVQRPCRQPNRQNPTEPNRTRFQVNMCFRYHEPSLNKF